MEYTHPKGKGYGKYNGMLRSSDWIGQRVIATRQIMNHGGRSVKSGATGTVKHAHNGLQITFDVCAHCGTVLHVTKVNYSEIELFEGKTEQPRDFSEQSMTPPEF